MQFSLYFRLLGITSMDIVELSQYKRPFKLPEQPVIQLPKHPPKQFPPQERWHPPEQVPEHPRQPPLHVISQLNIHPCGSLAEAFTIPGALASTIAPKKGRAPFAAFLKNSRLD